MGMKERTSPMTTTQEDDGWHAWVRGQDGVVMRTLDSDDFPDEFVFIPLTSSSNREFNRARLLEPIFEGLEELVSRIRVRFSF
jgi:hypothetical protein